MPNFFELKECDFPWGDYGHTLLAGLAARNADGPLRLQRTGPFVPPIAFPYFQDPVVTDIFRGEIGNSPFKGVKFRKAKLVKAVKLKWESWDRNKDKPVRPHGGEPENYILGRKHDPIVARAMGILWEMIVPVDENFIVETVRRGTNFHSKLVAVGEPRFDLFHPTDTQQLIVTEGGKHWLEGAVGEWVSFEKLRLKVK